MKLPPPILTFKNIITATKHPASIIICCRLVLQANDNDFAKNKATQNHIGMHIGRATNGSSITIPNIGFVIYSLTENGISEF